MGHDQPDSPPVLDESGVLEGLGALEAVFTLPGEAVLGDVDIEDAPADAVDPGELLPAEEVGSVELIERRLGAGALLDEGLLAPGRPGPAILTFAEPVVVVAVLLAADGQPGAVGQTIDRGLGQGRAAGAVEVADDFEGVGGGVQRAKCLLGADVVVDRDIGAAVEFLEVIEQVKTGVDGLTLEALLGGVGVQILWLQVEDAVARVQLHAMDLALEGQRAEVEVAIVSL